MEKLTPSKLTDKGICPTCYDKKSIIAYMEIIEYFH